jgi:hypothetical protein
VPTKRRVVVDPASEGQAERPAEVAAERTARHVMAVAVAAGIVF